MLFPALAIWIALFFSPKPSPPVQHFVPVPVSRFPKDTFLREFCDRDSEDFKYCWQSFRDYGAVWAADLDGDHIDELIIEPRGDWEGSGGEWFFLYQKQGTDWVPLQQEGGARDSDDGVGWQTHHPRFDVLPIERSGHHDLRVEADACLKWDGGQYIWYDPEDYHQLSPAWFDAEDNNQAEIFWAIRYAGQKTMPFEPQWFPLGKNDFLKMDQPLPKSLNSFPRFAVVGLDDTQEDIRWVGLLKGGTWGIRGNRAFLLAPQLGYLGISHFRIEGDWLLGFGDGFESEEDEGPTQPDIRYNRRTHELQLHSDGMN